VRPAGGGAGRRGDGFRSGALQAGDGVVGGQVRQRCEFGDREQVASPEQPVGQRGQRPA
jgi:hypothetical protein